MAEPLDRPDAPTPPNPPAPPAALRPFPTAGLPSSYAPAQRSPEEAGYKPLSALAVAGFAIGMLYALIVTVVGIVAFRNATPEFLSYWSLLPIIAAVLCVLAWVQINRSEGTLAGAALAKWGLVVSITFGLGYAAFSTATYLAVADQADAFAQQFFNELKQNKVNAAYLLTQETSVRQGVQPEDDQAMEIRFNAGGDNAPGPSLGRFRNSDLARILRQGGPETKMSPLGISDWSYKNGYKVRRQYAISNEEGKGVVDLSVLSTDSRNRDFPKREWAVILLETGLRSWERTDLGVERDLQRQNTKKFLDRWAEFVTSGQLELAFLMTLPEDERGKTHKEFMAQRAAAALAVCSMPARTDMSTVLLAYPALDSQFTREVYLKGFYDFATRGLIFEENKVAIDDQPTLKVLKEKLPLLFRPGFEGAPSPMIKVIGCLQPTVNDKPGKLGFPNRCQINVTPQYRCDVTILVEGSDKWPTPGSKHSPGWRIARMQVLSGTDVVREGMTGQPPNPGQGPEYTPRPQ